MSLQAEQRQIHVFRDTPWHVPKSNSDPASEPTPAAEGDVGRRLLVQGQSGFYTQIVRLPPGFAAPSHSHDHAEVFMVIEGSCSFDGALMEQFDSTVVEAGQPYSFTAGADGLMFLVTRQAKANFQAVPT